MGVCPIQNMLCYDVVAIEQLALLDQMGLVNGHCKWIRIEFIMFIYVKIYFMHVIYNIIDISISEINKIYMVIV